MRDPLRHHHTHEALHGTFGKDWYGRFAEKVARSLGTPMFLAVQTTLLVAWIVLNGIWVSLGVHWDPYPFILLNLCLSFQAAYAAPLILVAQNRQAERDYAQEIADAKHREENAVMHQVTLEEIRELVLELKSLSAGSEGDT